MRVTIKTANTNVPIIAAVHPNLKSNVICVNCGREDFNNSKVATISPYLDEIGIIEQSGHVFIFPAVASRVDCDARPPPEGAHIRVCGKILPRGIRGALAVHAEEPLPGEAPTQARDLNVDSSVTNSQRSQIY